MLFAEGERRLYEGEIGVIGNEGLREGRELDALFAQLAFFFTTFSTVPCRLYSTGLI